MGILSRLFGGKDNSDPDRESFGDPYISEGSYISEDSYPEDDKYTVEDTFKLKDSKDLIVVGKIGGTVREGDKVYIEGSGENDLISVKELNIFKDKVESATDTAVAMCLENGTVYGISKGTVLRVKF